MAGLRAASAAFPVAAGLPGFAAVAESVGLVAEAVPGVLSPLLQAERSSSRQMDAKPAIFVKCEGLIFVCMIIYLAS